MLDAVAAAAKAAEQALKRVDGVVAQADGAAGGEDVAALLRELKATARSARSLTDMLERHPEVLLRGKSAEEGP